MTAVCQLHVQSAFKKESSDWQLCQQVTAFDKSASNQTGSFVVIVANDANLNNSSVYSYFPLSIKIW